MTHRGERRLDGIAGTDARVRSPRSSQAGKDAHRQPADAGRCHRPTDTPSGLYRAAGASTGRTPGPSGSSGAKRRLPTALQPLYQPGLGALSVEMPFSPRGDRRASRRADPLRSHSPAWSQRPVPPHSGPSRLAAPTAAMQRLRPLAISNWTSAPGPIPDPRNDPIADRRPKALLQLNISCFYYCPFA
jgi:hypothetical protein